MLLIERPMFRFKLLSAERSPVSAPLPTEVGRALNV